MIKPASYYDKLDDGSVVCRLCPAECKLTEGKAGICQCRINQNGELVTNNYGELVTLAVDPIEKKPLYHFYPSSNILSTGPNCCNLECRHCQNWTISQRKVKTLYFPPEKLVEEARFQKLIGIAFTYTEPMVWYEYIVDTAPLFKKAGYKVVLVSNGYINAEPLKKLLGVVDAINIDLKGIRPEFYLKVCKGKIQPVLDNIRMVYESGVHLELTNLIIPSYNDSDDEIKDLVDFVASVSDIIPLHFSAYHPSYKMDIPATPAKTMLKAAEIGKKKLKYIYVGNISLDGHTDTYCPKCQNLLIRRNWYRTAVVGLNGTSCANCGFQTGIIL